MDDIGDALQGVAHNDEEAPPDLNISEVLHAISIADPTFGVGVEEMYRQPTAPQPSAIQPSGAPSRLPYVRIVEQPAGKSLRFRYECEGRSAGSIPGVHSTPERKTYPAIEVVGYTGRFVVLVSCVTREKPYRPHPHNLVGREPLCNRGVCTVECNGDNSIVQFSNLGIQCVKRKDIAEALRVREEIKVDPFKTGFNHKNQPQNIDLNAVRLCFQVYIPGGNTSKIKQALAPVVSDVIYDKKAMCELQINRLSCCAASVRGGTELILLCEKVTRDDVEVLFSQTFDDGSAWEATAHIVLVHKQVAIAFQAPAYRDPTCMEHVKVKIFLKRTSDGARSLPVDFEYTPDYQGTAHKAPPDRAVLSLLLADRTDSNNNDDKRVSSSSDSVSGDSGDSGEARIADLNGSASDQPLDNERGLDELLDQVAELDEIYSESRTRLQNVAGADGEDPDDFDDAGTYTSLQLAFRNPVLISEPEQYEDVQVQTYRGPIIEFAPLKRDTDDERAPPLPPKRVRKTPSVEGFKTSQTSVNSFLKPDSDYLSKKKRKTAQSIDSFLTTYKQDMGFHESAIKKEPRDASPALQIHSPPMGVASPPIGVASPHYPPPQYREPADQYLNQQWIDQSNLAIPNTNPFLTHAPDARGYWGPQNFGQASPSPNLQAMSPNMAMSPSMQAISPQHRLSPSMQSMAGAGMAMNAGMAQLPPLQGGVSPAHPSPLHHASPPHLQPMQPVAQAQDLGAAAPLDSDMQFNSADLSGIIATLGPPELSDSLRALSTSELIPTMQPM